MNTFRPRVATQAQPAKPAAKAEIAHGKSAGLKAMSRKIIMAQQKEIAQLVKWMAAHK